MQNKEDLIFFGLIAFGAYLLYRTFTGVKSIAVNASQAAGSSAADAAQYLLGNGLAQPGQVYSVTMPDGSIQTVAYGSQPGAGPLPASGVGTTIGSGNDIADALNAGLAAGG